MPVRVGTNGRDGGKVKGLSEMEGTPNVFHIPAKVKLLLSNMSLQKQTLHLSKPLCADFLKLSIVISEIHSLNK